MWYFIFQLFGNNFGPNFHKFSKITYLKVLKNYQPFAAFGYGGQQILKLIHISE